MITLSTSGNSIIFTFQDNQHYLQNGTIEVPKNSLLLVTDDSNMATFKKSASNDIFISALYSELGMSKSELEAWFEENATTNYGGGGGGGIDSGTVQSMIDASISGKADTSALTAYTLTSVTEALDGIVTAHTANTAIHVTVGDKLTWDGKQDALTAGTGIDITNDVISCTVTGGGNNVVELTQAQYDTLVDKDPDAFYIITDAPAIDLSGYAQTSAVTAEITAAVSGKQDTLVSGTNIKTINNQSLLGSGNIDIQGGGGSYTAGDGIDITNDVISTSYSGYPVFDSGTTTPESNLYNFEGQCLILCPIDCEGSTDGIASFSVDGHSYQIIFYPETQTYDDNGDSTWQDYFTLDWNDTYGAFMLTTIQPIDASDVSCVRFLTSEIRYSGTTTDGINGALEVATKVDKQLGGLKFVRLTQEEYDALTTKHSDTLYIVVPTFGGLTVYYSIDGQAAQNEITLFNGGGESSGESSGSEGGGALPTTMIVDGVEETPVNTWRFEEGNHIVQYTFEDNTVPQMFLNGIDYAYEIEIGDDITAIADSFAGDGVFAGMPALQKATIGKNVTTIGDYAFNTSTNLSTDGIYVKATTPPTLGGNAFDNTDNCPILVPTGTYGDYISDVSWSVYGQRIAELS